MITLDAISLPSDLEWTDEHNWSPVSQDITPTLTGALIVEESTQQAGRPITLRGGRDACWITKDDVEALQAKADTAGLVMSLDYHGTIMSVMFKRDKGEALEASLVKRIENPQPTDYFYFTIRLMEI